VVRPIHDRMPVILAATDFAAWLDPRTAPAELHTLLRPLLGRPCAHQCPDTTRKRFRTPARNGYALTGQPGRVGQASSSAVVCPRLFSMKTIFRPPHAPCVRRQRRACPTGCASCQETMESCPTISSRCCFDRGAGAVAPSSEEARLEAIAVVHRPYFDRRGHKRVRPGEVNANWPRTRSTPWLVWSGAACHIVGKP
jgi:hypothetical protein